MKQECIDRCCVLLIEGTDPVQRELAKMERDRGEVTTQGLLLLF